MLLNINFYSSNDHLRISRPHSIHANEIYSTLKNHEKTFLGHWYEIKIEVSTLLRYVSLSQSGNTVLSYGQWQ